MNLRKEVVNGCAYYEDGSDINVGSIEEDIKILNKLVTTKFNNDYSIDNVDKDAIEHILQHYTREKQINEEHHKENGELREKVKELEAKLEFKQWGDLDNIRFEEYMNEFIPTQKIKDKIEEINKEYNRIHSQHYRDCGILEEKCKAKKDVLEELLQQNENKNMNLKGAIKNLKEIVELAEKEINNNDVNVTAILDLKDLKSLQVVINKLEGEE